MKVYNVASIFLVGNCTRARRSQQRNYRNRFSALHIFSLSKPSYGKETIQYHSAWAFKIVYLTFVFMPCCWRCLLSSYFCVFSLLYWPRVLLEFFLWQSGVFIYNFKWQKCIKKLEFEIGACIQSVSNLAVYCYLSEKLRCD